MPLMNDGTGPESGDEKLTDHHDDEAVSAQTSDAQAGDDRDGSARRRWLIIGAVVAVALLLLVVLPGYIVLQPRFYDRYPGLSEKYEPWSTSTHVEVGCQECHVRPTALAQTGYRARMVGEFYASLVTRSREPQVFDSPTNEACLACHDDLRSVSPSGDLRIPHRAHVAILEMECVECHNYLVHEPNPQGTNTPPMSGCLRCHDGEAAQDTCTACHTEKAAPDTHGSADWLVVHAEEAEDPDCESCHEWTDDWCVDCHTRRPASHGEDWRAVHGDRVATHRSCEACHDGTFCDRCHGEVPQLNFDPTLELVQ
jgi:hypothetical protein